MLIDWFTVVAQALNFFILVWLMKKVLYKPILAAIDAREKLVASELAAAAANKSEADKAMEEFKAKNVSFDRERGDLLLKATEEAKSQGVRLLEQARAAADALQAKRREALQREMDDFGQALGRRAQEAFFELARHALKDLADTSLEDQIAVSFCRKLRLINGEAKAKFTAAIAASADPVLVRSAFALPLQQQSILQTALNETFQRQILVRYEVAPKLIGGIDLTAGGQRLAWSIADYLDALERATSVTQLNAASGSAANPEAVLPTTLPVRGALAAAV